jgi:hypothetical protein
MYGVGAVPVATELPGVVSPEGQRIADALVQYSKQVKALPFLRGVRYDGIAFAEARARASSLVEQGAQAVGTTTLSRADLQQLLIGGANLMYTLGLNVRVTSYLEGAQYRAYEQRVKEFANRFMPQMVEIASQGARAGVDMRGLRGGLGFIPFIAVGLAVLVAYLLAMDDGGQLANDLCSQDPTSEACRRALDIYEQNKTEPQDPFSAATRDVSEAIGSVIKWVGIGAAVLGVGYLLWTFGPLLIGGGRKIREASKRRLAS